MIKNDITLLLKFKSLGACLTYTVLRETIPFDNCVDFKYWQLNAFL